MEEMSAPSEESTLTAPLDLCVPNKEPKVFSKRKKLKLQSLDGKHLEERECLKLIHLDDGKIMAMKTKFVFRNYLEESEVPTVSQLTQTNEEAPEALLWSSEVIAADSMETEANENLSNCSPIAASPRSIKGHETSLENEGGVVLIAINEDEVIGTDETSTAFRSIQTPAELFTFGIDDTINEIHENKCLDHKASKIKRSAVNDEADDPDKSSDQRNVLTFDLTTFDILQEALNNPMDKKLRGQALKALADCGSNEERLVPKLPPPGPMCVQNMETQTEVYGLIVEENFLAIKEHSEDHSSVEQTGTIDQNPQENMFLPAPSSNPPLNLNLDDLLIFNSDPDIGKTRTVSWKSNPLIEKLYGCLKEDFKKAKVWDENGLLSIHRAVLSGGVQQVKRQLMVLKDGLKESVDLRTKDGKTSLELARQHGIDSEIVKLLLEAGAQAGAQSGAQTGAQAGATSNIVDFPEFYLTNEDLLGS